MKVCPECHAQLVTSARAALAVLADREANPTDRTIAADVLAEDARWLAHPVIGQECQS